MRELRANEIEVRVAQCGKNGVSLLLYKDSRCDMRILDETFGVMGWRDSYQSINGELFCTIEVWDEQKLQWIGKQSNGTPSNMEAEKGRASDAFKRAGFMLGIGRELYTAPFIWVPADKCNIKPGKNGRMQCYDKFSCEKVRIENGIITGLSICNDTKLCRAFVYTREER
nr:MAG TPA: Rad52/22 family double-strand break repair protein [Caudoviricetes sp.]